MDRLMALRRVYSGREAHATSMVGYFGIELGAERCLLRVHEKTGAGQYPPFTIHGYARLR
jgi:hypothetical protein